MKVMSREFTRSEKILLVVLGVLLLGLLYYKFVFLTTSDITNSLKSQADAKQTELEIAEARLDKLHKMENEINQLEMSGDYSRMESYNASKKETAFLNKVLKGVEDYSISFSDITRDGDQIRRSFALQFTTNSYSKAQDVVADLSYGKYRCLVDDINYTLSRNDQININLTATFFETMVGGTPDAALPKDQSKTETDLADDLGVQ